MYIKKPLPSKISLRTRKLISIFHSKFISSINWEILWTDLNRKKVFGSNPSEKFVNWRRKYSKSVIQLIKYSYVILIVAYWPSAELSKKRCTGVNNSCIRSKISRYHLERGWVEFGAITTPQEAGGYQTII